MLDKAERDEDKNVIKCFINNFTHNQIQRFTKGIKQEKYTFPFAVSINMLWKKNTDQNIGWLQPLDLGPISWLCLLPNSALTITIPLLRASAEFLRLPCKRRMSSNVEYARAEAKIPRLPVKYTCHKHKIICFRKCRFFAYGKQSHEIGP